LPEAHKLIECQNDECKDNCGTPKFAKPELRLVAKNNPSDARLVEIVRILARRAARKYFEKQKQERDKVRP
jgi:hypothetical protein